MNLKEAREMANECRGTLMVDDSSVHATVILDDRITELEKQIKNDTGYREMKTLYNQIVKENKGNYEKRKELETQNKKLVEELVETIAYHINPIKPPPPQMAIALKKIKQPALRAE